jgi:hypothetical protein
MSEALFILTTIFVAYVVYKTVNEQKATPKFSEPKAKPKAPKAVTDQLRPEIVFEKVKPTKIKPATIKKTTPLTTNQDAVKIIKKGLRDPKTGEVATTYSNYRFTKRWIKDALVAEGLLEKVYKNNELDSATEATIKDAIVKLEAIDKYKP